MDDGQYIYSLDELSAYWTRILEDPTYKPCRGYPWRPGRTPGYIIIVIYWPWDCPKRTVYYWKYTARHINQPAQTIPTELLDVIA